MKNITVSVDDDLYYRARIRASERRTTVSALVRGFGTPDALGHAASAIFAVLEHTAARGDDEMRIVEAADALVNPLRRFAALSARI